MATLLIVAAAVALGLAALNIKIWKLNLVVLAACLLVVALLVMPRV
jgi:hypothetical protein